MIALKQDGSGGPFAAVELAAGGAFYLNILLNFLAVELYADKFSVFSLFPIGVEAGSAERDVKGLPFAGGLAGIAGGGAGVVNAAEIAGGELVVGFAKAVE